MVYVFRDCLDGDFDECDASGRHRDVERGYFAAGVLSNLLLCNDWTQVILDVCLGQMKDAKRYAKNKFKAAAPF